MAKTDLTRLTYAELSDLKEQVEAALVESKASEAREVKAKLEALAQKSGFSLTELVDGRHKKRGRKAAATAKYRNPKDPSQTWSGRGRKPNWLVGAVKKGAKLESFLA